MVSIVWEETIRSVCVSGVCVSAVLVLKYMCATRGEGPFEISGAKSHLLVTEKSVVLVVKINIILD